MPKVSGLSIVRPPWPEIVTNTLTLAWQEPINSDLPVAFYRLYLGTNSGTYFASFNTSQPTNQTTITFTRSRFTQVYIVAVSVTADGIESLPSNEVDWPSPVNIVSNVVLVLSGPFPAPIYTRDSLTSGSWQFFTNAVDTNTIVPVDQTVTAKFFTSDRVIYIKTP